MIPVRRYDPAPGKILFYDVRDPMHPVKMFYEILDESNDAVGITKLSDGRYLLVDQGPNLYLSARKTLGGDLSPEFKRVEQSGRIVGGEWRGYQNINIVVQPDGQMFLLGMYNTYTAGLGDDMIHVWKLEVDKIIIAPGEVKYEFALTKVGERHVDCDVIWGGEQANFAAATGVYVDPDGRLLVYATEYYNGGPEGLFGRGTVKCMEFRNQYHPSDEEMIKDGWVELYADPGFGGRSLMIDFDDRYLKNYEDFNQVELFTDVPSSAR